MLQVLLTLLSPSAESAAPEFVEISEPFELLENGGGGNWARLIPRPADPPDDTADSGEAYPGGWWLLMSHGVDLFYRELDLDMKVVRESPTNMTNHGGLVDHSIAICPDGGILDAASSTTTLTDDTLVIFRWDADLNLINSYTLAEEGALVYADAPSVCAAEFTATGGFMYRYEEGELETVNLYVLDPDTAELLDTWSVTSEPSWFGATLLWDPLREAAVSVRMPPGGDVAHFTQLDPDGGGETHRWDVIIAEEGDAAFWPVRAIQLGDHWVMPVVYQAADEEYRQGGGDIYVALMDNDFDLVSVTKVGDYDGGAGGIQPWVALLEGTLGVSWSAENRPYAVSIDVNFPPEAAAEGPLEVVVGEVATIDGSASSDILDDELSYSWSMLVQPEGSTATLADVDAVAATLVPDLEGLYMVTLEVSDGSLSDTAVIELIAVAAPPEDSGGADSGEVDTSSPDGGDDTAGAPADGGPAVRCACGGGSAAWLLLLTLGVVRRRRR